MKREDGNRKYRKCPEPGGTVLPEADILRIFDSVPDPCLVLDTKLRIVEVNHAYLEVTMTKRAEILGRDIFEVFPDNPSEPDATGVRNLRQSLNYVLLNQVPDAMVIQKYDIRKPEEDGGGFEERYWSPVNSPVLGDDGKVSYIIHRVQDVTEFVRIKHGGREKHRLCEEMRESAVQKDAEIYVRSKEVAEINQRLKLANEELARQQEELKATKNGLAAEVAQRREAETALRESEERFASFMHHLPAAAWIKDLDGRYIYANDQAGPILSMSVQGLQGKTDEDVFPLEVAREFRKFDRRVLAEGGSLQTRQRLIQSDGIEHHFIVNKFVVPGFDDKPAYVAGVAFDITELKRTEESLRESREKFSKIFDMAPVGITISSLSDGRFVDVNREGERLSGYRREEVIGRTALEFDIWKDPAERFSMIEEIKEKGVVRDREMTFRDRKGDILCGLFSAAVIDIQGEKHLLSIVSDITQRKKLEDERERLLAEFEAVLDSLNEGVVVCDLEGNIKTMNQAALGIYGFEKIEDFPRGLPRYREFFELSGLDGAIVPVDRWPLARAGQGERFTDYELHVLRKDTGKSWICSYSGTPVRTRSNDIILCVITLRDITDRKREDEAFKESEARFHAIFNLAAVGIAQVSLTGQWMLMNQKLSDILGYSFAELESMTLLQISHPDDIEPHLAHIRRLIAGEAPSYTMEKRYIRKDGSILWVNLNVTLVRDQYDNPLYFIAVVEDITERKDVEEEMRKLNMSLQERTDELKEANRDLESFNYSVAHDLRQPLNVISGYIQTVQMLCGELLAKECRDYVKEAYKSTLRMDGLIEALLNFSRMGRVELKRARVDLSLLAEEVSLSLRVTDPDRKVDFVIEPGMEAYCDANLMRVVISNLLGNAWKYTSRKELAVIEFRAQEMKGTRTFLVRDNGAGFDMAHAAKLFAPFQRLPDTERYGGFGIGLATVERVIRRHGGEVCAEGEPDRGSTFYFTLPGDES